MSYIGGHRFSPYRRLFHTGCAHHERLPFLTRNVPAVTFATELGLEHAMADFERELSDELAQLLGDRLERKWYFGTPAVHS